MSLSEKLNKHPTATIGGACVLIAAAIVIAIFALFPGQRKVYVPTKAFYTTDDGKTLFADAAGKLTPFEHDGKEAVRARVKKTSDGQEVTYLIRYPDAYLKAMNGSAPAATGPAKIAPGAQQLPPSFHSMPAKAFELVKRPGDSEWVPLSSPEGLKISELGPQYGHEAFPQ